MTRKFDTPQMIRTNGIYRQEPDGTRTAIQLLGDRVVVDAAGGIRQVGGTAPITRLTPATISTAGNATYTAAQMLGGLILRDPNGGARSDVTPTAALLIAAMNEAGIDDSFDCLVVNTADAAEVVTITAGTGVTLVPASVTPTQNETTLLVVRVTGAATVTIYALTAGA